MGLVTFLGTCIWLVLPSGNMLRRLQMLLTYANISVMESSYFYLLSLHMPWVLHQHLVCVAVRKYVATLADVVNVRERKFHGMFIEYVVALSDALGDPSIWFVFLAELGKDVSKPNGHGIS